MKKDARTPGKPLLAHDIALDPGAAQGEPDRASQGRRGVVREWARAGLRPGLVYHADGLHPLLHPAAGDPGAELDHVVDPSDAGSKPRKYTVLVDEPIELPR